MFYVYVLQSLKDKMLYLGYTVDLRERFKLHLSGRVPSTKRRLPLKLIYHEAYCYQVDARGREQFLKSGSGLTYLKKQLKNYLKSN